MNKAYADIHRLPAGFPSFQADISRDIILAVPVQSIQWWPASISTPLWLRMLWTAFRRRERKLWIFGPRRERIQLHGGSWRRIQQGVRETQGV
ncbi:hypothetical protein P9422_09400 [Bacillus atrophaeus]|uniref:hypothetical protein n=1 Tax=Bacillus atrophaeus TaxID=1452 RepID=UPI002E1B39E3|nr:hypothetical protein [Bacillus atrophaeus]